MSEHILDVYGGIFFTRGEALGECVRRYQEARRVGLPHQSFTPVGLSCNQSIMGWIVVRTEVAHKLA